jgi:pyridoxine 4-dehydrogenase
VAGEFYGPDCSNIKLISRFFKKYPEYADRAFLSVKGGAKLDKLEPDSSPENLRRSVTAINEALDGAKRLDLFEAARVDPAVSIEDTIKTLKGLIEEGLFDYIGVSEVKAETLVRANKVHPIAAVEIEVSLWSYEEETKKGTTLALHLLSGAYSRTLSVIQTAKELGVAVLGYSPIGRGILTGQIKKWDDIPEGDFRRMLTRYSPEVRCEPPNHSDDSRYCVLQNFDHNLELVRSLSAFAKQKGVTPAQLAISWVAQLGPHVIPLPGSSKKERTLENLGSADIKLSSEEIKEIDSILGSFTVKGGRYNDAMEAHFNLWG